MPVTWHFIDGVLTVGSIAGLECGQGRSSTGIIKIVQRPKRCVTSVKGQAVSGIILERKQEKVSRQMSEQDYRVVPQPFPLPEFGAVNHITKDNWYTQSCPECGTVFLRLFVPAYPTC